MVLLLQSCYFQARSQKVHELPPSSPLGHTFLEPNYHARRKPKPAHAERLQVSVLATHPAEVPNSSQHRPAAGCVRFQPLAIESLLVFKPSPDLMEQTLCPHLALSELLAWKVCGHHDMAVLCHKIWGHHFFGEKTLKLTPE